MKNIKIYNIYIFISTFTRNIIDIYSVIYLYKQGISIKNILAIYANIYLLGSLISKLSITIGNKIGYKYILILSSIITGLSFYIIKNTTNLYLIALFLSLSIFTYHPIRHLYGIRLLKKDKEIGITLILTYLASLLSSYLAIKELKIIYLIIISIIGIIPAIFIKKEKTEIITYPKRIPSKKLSFFILDQFKIIFLLLEPLYLYLVMKKISDVGIFNIIITISSIICIYLITNKINITKKYKYLNIIFTIILILKLNIENKYLLFIIAIFEGLGIKINELISTINLYDNHKLNEGYIIKSEQIFCFIRSLILSIIYFLNLNLLTNLYLLLIGIFFLSFMYQKQSRV